MQEPLERHDVYVRYRPTRSIGRPASSRSRRCADPAMRQSPASRVPAVGSAAAPRRSAVGGELRADDDRFGVRPRGVGIQGLFAMPAPAAISHIGSALGRRRSTGRRPVEARESRERADAARPRTADAGAAGLPACPRVDVDRRAAAPGRARRHCRACLEAAVQTCRHALAFRHRGAVRCLNPRETDANCGLFQSLTTDVNPTECRTFSVVRGISVHD